MFLRALSSRIINVVCVSLLLVSAALPVRGQDAEWEDRVATTFVFEISDREAEKLLRSDRKDSLMRGMIHTQVARFNGEWDNAPTQGHFIYTRVDRNRLECDYVQIMPFKIFLYKEYGALSLQITEMDGTPRRDAEVKIRRRWHLFDRKVPFDDKSNVYRVREDQQTKNIILSVELNGFRAVIDLNKYMPWQGWGGEPHTPEFYSYMVTDKNKYKPGDNIRFKSYALSGSRHPLEKELEVWLNGSRNGEFRKISTLTPYNPGGYAGEIVLHDSLGLQLDRRYSIQLRDRKGRIAARRNFLYEDYTLYDNSLKVKVRDRVHYHPAANSVEISATDANGLPIPDATADVLVRRMRIDRTYADVLMLPDTLLFERIKLRDGGPTTMDIPASVFGEADGAYMVDVTVVTYDGQRMTASDMAQFYRSRRQIAATTHGDTIRFEYLEEGRPATQEAELSLDGEDSLLTVTLPYEEPFDQTRREYRFRSADGGFEQRIHIGDIDPQLDIEGGIEHGSFDVRLVNPLKLDVSWYVYRGGTLIRKGSGKDMHMAIPKAAMDMVYYVDVFYVMGGSERTLRRSFVPETDLLKIESDLPERVYPGQKVDATVRVSDHRGKPVSGADLTAMAWNGKLDYHVPEIPRYGSRAEAREQQSEYSFRRNHSDASLPLDYDVWCVRAGLDTLNYYRLAYPRGLFQHETPAPDGVTQFAPYVMKDGAAVDIHVIEDNRRPVYFSWTEQPAAYSFPVDPAKLHSIMLRLHDRVLVIDSLKFSAGQKTTLSVDLDNLPRGVRTMRIGERNRHGNYLLTPAEKDHYNFLIARFPVIDRTKPAFIETMRWLYPKRADRIRSLTWTGYIDHDYGDSILIFHPLLPDRRARARGQHYFNPQSEILAGPVPPGMSSYANSVEYWHEGGFNYNFQGNVIYKSPEKVVPDSLLFSSRSHITNLGDFHLSATVLAQKERDIERRNEYWQPSEIYVSREDMELHFRLPERTDSVGIANIIFLDRERGRVVYPNRRHKVSHLTSWLAPGCYDIVALYYDGSYLRRDSVKFATNAYTGVNLAELPLRPADSLSGEWIKRYNISATVETNGNDSLPDLRTLLLYRRSGQYGNTVCGYVIDTEGKPLPDVSVSVKDKNRGTTTRYDGYFDIDVDAAHSTLLFNRVGFETKELTVNPRSVMQVVLEKDTRVLDEIVVMGIHSRPRESFTGAANVVMRGSIHPVDDNTNIATSLVLHDLDVVDTIYGDFAEFSEEAAFAEFAEVAADGPLGGLRDLDPSYGVDGSSPNRIPPGARPESPEEAAKREQAEAEERLYRELLTLNGLRDNFSDVGFWQPALVTDRQGEAAFSVTLPDDITQWNAAVYAMNRRLQTGLLRHSIRSYKPLMAELRMPQFLVAGDTAQPVANIRNHTSDSIVSGHASFALGADTLMRKPVGFTSSHTDLIEITAPVADSLTATYLFTRDDGYTDGERRTIPIVPVGTEIAEGSLRFLRDGERTELAAGDNETLNVMITGNQADVYLDAAHYLRDYRYDCNEQLASKLIGLLNLKLYAEYNGTRFDHDRQVNRIVRRLTDNRNEKQLWSWWGNSPSTSHWISARVLHSLKMARDYGYNVDIDPRGLSEYYFDVAGYRRGSFHDVEILHALSDWGAEQPYGQAVEYWEEEIGRQERIADATARREGRERTRSWLHEKLLLWEIRQTQGLDFKADSVAKYLKTDMLGGVYCDDGIGRPWQYDALATTLIAYRIVGRDSTLAHNKEPMQMHILGTRQRGWNTYRSAGVVATMFPDLLAASSRDVPAMVHLSGKEERTVTEFPYRTTLAHGERLGVEKQHGMPLILSSWTTKMQTEARTGEAFDIETRMHGDGRFAVGQVDTLMVTVRVRQAGADHVMIEVPIPAGCDYASKPQSRRGPEVHREYFKEKTVIFCEHMPQGEYTFRIALLPRFTGRYTVNPAKVELMYFPTVSSNNDLRRMEIE